MRRVIVYFVQSCVYFFNLNTYTKIVNLCNFRTVSLMMVCCFCLQNYECVKSKHSTHLDPHWKNFKVGIEKKLLNSLISN